MGRGPLIGRLIVMRRWDPSTNFVRDLLTTVPIRIRLHWLPPQLWCSSAIMKLASGVGKPLRADPLTAWKERLSYARIFLEISATDVLVEELEIELPSGKMFFQKVEYEWVPPMLWTHYFSMSKNSKERDTS
ncbi:uncharacterized protein M6B38_139920 [Iris pallida]|uniref:Uncharacterized protein n=1 Tax=Iris pallida TaxID=29817 RepID=A0AAX6FEH4_IRIPA|nr:uncharacterized protein M6B38_139920 [Iris pallida]